MSFIKSTSFHLAVISVASISIRQSKKSTFQWQPRYQFHRSVSPLLSSKDWLCVTTVVMQLELDALQRLLSSIITILRVDFARNINIHIPDMFYAETH